MPDVSNDVNRELIIALAARYRVRAIYFNRFFSELGGLISYGDVRSEQFRLAAGYIDRILKGEKPADLPLVRRREFITLLCSVGAWPLAASAQQKPVIGFLNSGSPDAYPDRVIAFHQGLRQLGYIEGENVVVDYRWALGEYDRLPAFAAELVKRRVSVLVATGGEPAALAAKSATSTIPIVFAIGGDPIKLGLVATYNRPGGNATGANILAAEMDGKRLALLHEMMPNVASRSEFSGLCDAIE